MSVDLDSYFHRIGYTGPHTPTLETLQAIHVLHPQAITFENLDPVLRQPVPLDVGSIAQKLVTGRRGGYCLEQNLLLIHVLRALGFKARGLGARVLWNQPAGAITPRVHMLVQVDVDGEPYVADVGFGGLTLTAPLRLKVDVEQQTPHESFRLTAVEDGFRMEAIVGDAWKPLYRFDLQEQFQVDFEVANCFHCTSPISPFNTVLMVARPNSRGRSALRNNQLAIHSLDGASERSVLGSASDLRQALGDIFGIELPKGTGVDALLNRMAAQPA